jgi:steroid 5-alpha reductase family enzyme
MNIFILTLILSFLIQFVFFIIANTYKTDKGTDLAYGTGIVVSVIAALYVSPGVQIIRILVVGLVVLWGIRLSLYLFIRIQRMGRDRRFDGIREHTRSFAAFWILQAIAVWIIPLPAVFIISSPVIAGHYDTAVLGIIITMIGLAIETLADWQKFSFKSAPENRHRFVTTGLWNYSRHPNYFGEMLFWWGIYLVSLPYMNGMSYVITVGPLFITFLLLFVSGIPPLERSHLEKYGDDPEYLDYIRKTSILIPLPKRP